jgi:hypothetical protein
MLAAGYSSSACVGPFTKQALTAMPMAKRTTNAMSKVVRCNSSRGALITSEQLTAFEKENDEQHQNGGCKYQFVKCEARPVRWGHIKGYVTQETKTPRGTKGDIPQGALQ